MDKLNNYRNIARALVEEIAQAAITAKDSESMLSVDDQHGQYLILSDSWDGSKRAYGPLVHIEVKPDAKVWLRYDGTDLEVGQELLNKGVAATDLVLAFHSPQMRKYTQFAAA